MDIFLDSKDGCAALDERRWRTTLHRQGNMREVERHSCSISFENIYYWRHIEGLIAIFALFSQCKDM